MTVDRATEAAKQFICACSVLILDNKISLSLLNILFFFLVERKMHGSFKSLIKLQ